MPVANQSLEQREPMGIVGIPDEHAPYRVASLTPTTPEQPRQREDQTTLVSLRSSAFPYFGNSPVTDQPFLNVSKDGRRGHRSLGGRVYWQNETYSDSRVLMHVPQYFDIRKPGIIVVFFHGNGATLERDVRDRQLVPQQISESGVNAVLLAPQLAVDAADSSAGKFWQPAGLKQFVSESAGHLARIYGDPGAARQFAKLPVIIVGYSGGFMPAAWSLEVGGLGNQVRGVFLLDAIYGELDKFASWIENNRSGVFVSAYTHFTKRHDEDLIRMLGEKGIAVSDTMDTPLRPGSVVFIITADTASHRDYVTRAWTESPLKDVLVKIAATPALTKVATTGSSSAGR
ncbi:MAG TPA: alpha/beta hydrolase [Bradyrhizobium sp.]|uniref:alpha/beta hydrolase n=1 Tax=Bradyrhizobium sp. TaxID=376 RepID=UPI002B49A620|nr:alpha/beta hydrolase [Bradyrhizobium sp.]HKO72686.1 alpha/beta hydrolase [Bradyrhizobium sp.]